MSDQDDARPSRRSQHGLDWLNFFVADVETGFGPFVAVYLGALGWSQGAIGMLLSVGAIATIAGQIPGGALVDAVPSKRLLVAVALGLIAVGALIFALFPESNAIYAAELLHGLTGGVMRVALAAMGLGLVGHRVLHIRLGRNQRYDSLGNAMTAAMMGVLGQFVAKRATFFAAAALCLPAGLALTAIRGREIDFARARSARTRDQPRQAARRRDLARNRPLLVFIGILVLFQLANAAIMPLASARLGRDDGMPSEIITSALVGVPELVTAVIAGWVARRAGDWGRKPLLIAGFAMLPLRALVFALAPGVWYLIGIQVLGGATAATIGILTPLVIADVTRGSGRYNLAQGIAGTATGVGAALSTAVAGGLAEWLGDTAGFLWLAAVGLAGLGCVRWLMPETGPDKA